MSQAVQVFQLPDQGLLGRFLLAQIVEDRRGSPVPAGRDHEMAYPRLDQRQLPLDGQPLVGELRLSRSNLNQGVLDCLWDQPLVKRGVETVEQRLVQRGLRNGQFFLRDRYHVPMAYWLRVST